MTSYTFLYRAASAARKGTYTSFVLYPISHRSDPRPEKFFALSPHPPLALLSKPTSDLALAQGRSRLPNFHFPRHVLLFW